VLQAALLDELESGPAPHGHSPGAVAIELTRRLFTEVEAMTDVLVAEYRSELATAAVDGTDVARLRAVRDVLRASEADGRLDFYDLRRVHTAVVATGTAMTVVHTLARERHGAGFAVQVDTDLCWAWLGEADPVALGERIQRNCPTGHAGIGGPASGTEGFRRAHREAGIALEVTRAAGSAVSLYAPASVAAIALNSTAECRALIHHQLGDLASNQPRDRQLRQTLRAYLQSGHNARTTAAALAVSERTVANRLAAIRQRLPPARSLGSIELAMAIRLLAELEPDADGGRGTAID
jgi:DNA-binding PucR family transcriptional regulator